MSKKIRNAIGDLEEDAEQVLEGAMRGELLCLKVGNHCWLGSVLIAVASGSTTGVKIVGNIAC